jgi:tRNA 2-thiouridine synthesizing protein A
MADTDQKKSADPEIAERLDTIGLKCPLPALKARRALARLGAGATLVVAADDPLAAIDIPHLVRELGHELVAASEDGGVMRFVIRKA